MKHAKDILWVLSLASLAAFVASFSSIEHHTLRDVIGNDPLPQLTNWLHKARYAGFCLLVFPAVPFFAGGRLRDCGTKEIMILCSLLLAMLWMLACILAWRIPWMHVYGPMTPYWQIK